MLFGTQVGVSPFSVELCFIRKNVFIRDLVWLFTYQSRIALLNDKYSRNGIKIFQQMLQLYGWNEITFCLFTVTNWADAYEIFPDWVIWYLHCYNQPQQYCPISKESNSKPQSVNIVCMYFSGFLKTYFNMK